MRGITQLLVSPESLVSVGLRNCPPLKPIYGSVVGHSKRA
jgi:hypothetical protein